MIELSFSQPESDADIRLVRGDPALVQFDMEHLRALPLDQAEYGQLLSQSLFSDPAVQTAFAQARSTAQTLEACLRLRLFIGPSATELHSLRWETLRDPQDGSAFLTSERLLFSRYLSSMDWRPVRLRPKADLRALVVVASPTDVANYQPGGRPLAALDVAGELARAKEGLGGIATTELASSDKATFNNLSGHLRDGYDILYLIEAWLLCRKPLLPGLYSGLGR